MFIMMNKGFYQGATHIKIALDYVVTHTYSIVPTYSVNYAFI